MANVGKTPPNLVRVIRRFGLAYLVCAPLAGAAFWIVVSPAAGISVGLCVGAVALYMVFGFRRVNDRLRRKFG